MALCYWEENKHMARYTGNHCPVCEQAFTDDDDIVVCPDCGTPYHRACWQKVGACVHEAEHADGFEWKPEHGPEAETAAAEAVCPNCGTHNQPGAARCSHCGVPLPKSGAESGPGPAPKDSGPIYARDPGAAGYAPPQNPRAAGEGRSDPYSAGADGGMYRREVGPDDPIDGIKARHWAAFVVRSPLYYLMQFFRMSETKHRVSFSFSAFFFGPLYLLYRKMWKEGIAVGIVMLLLTIPGQLSLIASYNPSVLGDMPLGWLFPAMWICDTLTWVIRVLLALFSLSLYEKRAKVRIEDICARVAEEPQRSEALARSGGVSFAAPLIYVCVMLMMSMLIVYMAGPAFVSNFMIDMGM